MDIKTTAKFKISGSFEQEILDYISEPITSYIKKETVNVIKDDVKISWFDLQQQAMQYIKIYELYKTVEEQLYNSEFKMLVFNEGLEIRRVTVLRNTYRAMVEFEHAVDIFLERIPRQILYITEMGVDSAGIKKVGSFLIDHEQLYKVISTDKRIKFGSRPRKLGQIDLSEFMSEAIDAQKQSMLAGKAYTGTTNRLEVYFSYYPPGAGGKQNGLLLWREGEGWHAERINNYGDVKEAYVSALLDRQIERVDRFQNESGDGGSAPYFSHSLIGSFYNNYMTTVDATGSANKEDVVIDNMIQFGIKSGNAQPPGLFQYYDLANNIVSSAIPITESDIEKIVQEQESRYAPSIVRSAAEITEMGLNKEMLETLS